MRAMQKASLFAGSEYRRSARPGQAVRRTIQSSMEETSVEIDALVGRKWTDIRAAARQRAAVPEPGLFDAAAGWYDHPSWEARFYAVLVLGSIAAVDQRALVYLHDRCGNDPAWQVHEGLAMAFDTYCAAVGYEQALPVIDTWLRSQAPMIRRAVSEGLRPWTAKGRPYFAANPLRAIACLGVLKDDPHRSVQESAGNALRDVGRKHSSLVLETVRAWIAERPESRSRRIIAKFALESAVKRDPALRALFEPLPAH